MHTYVYNIPISERPTVWNAMANNFVHRTRTNDDEVSTFRPSNTQERVHTCTQISGIVDSSRVRGMHCARLWRYGRFHRSRRSLSQVSRRRQLCPTPHEPARRDNEPNYASVGDDKGHEANLAYSTHLLLVFLAKNLRWSS